MDTQSVVMQLRQELSRIDAAIAALEQLATPQARRGRPAKSTSTGAPRRTMSAEAREKIAAAQRRRWARQRGKAGAKNVKTMPKGHNGISAAGRKKISEMMKARWAARRKAA
jgi:hypothetical protein